MKKRNKTVVQQKRSTFAHKSNAVHQTKLSGKKGSAFKKSKASSNPNRPDPTGGKPGSHISHRSRATINRINMYKSKPNIEKMKQRPTDPQAGKVQPNRKWFGNVRVADQKELDKYRKALADTTEKKGSGFSVHLKSKQLPLSLVKDTLIKSLSEGERLLQVQSYDKTFGPSSQRKKPNMTVGGLEEMMKGVEERHGSYNDEKDVDLHKRDVIDMKDATRHYIFEKGLSKRIWEELYKVIDSSDVLLFVLDARNPEGTRNKALEYHLKTNCPSKHLIFVLNKCDLVPTSITQKWIKYLQKFAPTLAFQASVNNPFGKGSVIQLLKQFDMLHKEKKNISVGFIGYPNVGKSSVINTLMKKVCCKVAPIPGETRVWQYITMTRRIYLIDCPGIVYDHGESNTDKVLKGVVRAEKVPDPDSYIQAILDRVQNKHITDIFGVHTWTDSEDFITQVAEKTGKLLSGGAPDINNVCKSIIMDWQRGNIPFFTRPPKMDKVTGEYEMQDMIVNKEDDVKEEEMGEGDEEKKDEEKKDD